MTNGLHHLHARTRMYRRLERFPHPNAAIRALDYLIYVVAIGSPLVLVPQVAQLYASRDVTGLSLSTWLLLGAINALWTAYGIVHRDVPIIVSSALMGALDVVIVAGILVYQ